MASSSTSFAETVIRVTDAFVRGHVAHRAPQFTLVGYAMNPELKFSHLNVSRPFTRPIAEDPVALREWFERLGDDLDRALLNDAEKRGNPFARLCVHIVFIKFEGALVRVKLAAYPARPVLPPRPSLHDALGTDVARDLFTRLHKTDWCSVDPKDGARADATLMARLPAFTEVLEACDDIPPE